MNSREQMAAATEYIRLACKPGRTEDSVLRLFAGWCVWQVKDLLVHPASMDAVQTSVRHARGEAPPEEMGLAAVQAHRAVDALMATGQGPRVILAAMAAARVANYDARIAAKSASQMTAAVAQDPVVARMAQWRWLEAVRQITCRPSSDDNDIVEVLPMAEDDDVLDVVPAD